MKKMVTLITTAVLLTANLNIDMVATAEDTECDHNWVEQTSIIHHDAEYETKTIWAHIYWATFDGENMMPDAPNEYDFGTSEGVFSYNRGDRVFNAEDLIDEFDLVSFGLDGIDYLDFPDETFRKRITINNYEEYGMTYEEFCNQTDAYNFFNHKNPEFNPELDELVDFSLDAREAGHTKYEEMYCDDLWNPTSTFTGSMNIHYANGSDPYWPIRQYQILVADAYDEEVTQYVCEDCGFTTSHISQYNAYSGYATTLAQTEHYNTGSDGETVEPITTADVTTTTTEETTTTTTVETTVETTTETAVETTEETTTETTTEFTETTETTDTTEPIETTEVTTVTEDDTEPEYILGDVNGNGRVEISDVIILQRWLLGCDVDDLIANWHAADICEDGCLNVFDLCLLKRLLIYGEI